MRKINGDEFWRESAGREHQGDNREAALFQASRQRSEFLGIRTQRLLSKSPPPNWRATPKRTAAQSRIRRYRAERKDRLQFERNATTAIETDDRSRPTKRADVSW
jgi:hypothetical protein